MIQVFKTKRDTCGNTYFLSVDTEKKTISRFEDRSPEAIVCVTTRKVIRVLRESAKREGFREA